MLAFGLVLNTVGIGLFCWLIFMLAVHALPFFVGVSAGLTALHSGAGPIGTLIVGCAAAALTLAVAQFTLALTRSHILRALLATSFVVPAALAGYFTVFGLLQLCAPSLIWREIFACLGAALVAITTWKRINALTKPRPIEQGGAVQRQPRSAFTGQCARRSPSPHRR